MIVDDRKIENQRMLQAMLADRAKLVLHRETVNLPSYALVVSENGPKLQPAQFTGDEKFKVPERDAVIKTDRDEKIAAEHKEMSAHRMLMQMDAGNEVIGLQRYRHIHGRDCPATGASIGHRRCQQDRPARFVRLQSAMEIGWEPRFPGKLRRPLPTSRYSQPLRNNLA